MKMNSIDQIPRDTKNALELASLILDFVARTELYSQQSCEEAAEYLERELSRDEEAPVRELAPHIAKFLRSQKDMEAS